MINEFIAGLNGLLKRKEKPALEPDEILCPGMYPLWDPMIDEQWENYF